MRHTNEATARIRINNLLEKAGWCFFPDGDKPALVAGNRELITRFKQKVQDMIGRVWCE